MTLPYRSDTHEYLGHFLFFMPDSPTWTRDREQAFRFNSHSDAEANARLILERLDDSTNTRVHLMSDNGETMLPVNVIRKI